MPAPPGRRPDGPARTGFSGYYWVAPGAMTLLPLATVIWRIRTEENALLATLGDPCSYQDHTKRLIPGVC